MADTNLSVSFVADTSKMRVELKLLNQDLKDLNKQIDAAIKTGDIAKANELSAAYGNIKKQSIELSRALKVQNTETVKADSTLKEFIHSGHGLGRVVGEFSNLSRGVESLTGIVGNLTYGFTGGLLGIAVARGFDALMAQMDAAAERLITIRDIARETGTKPLMVQGMQELAKESGESAETANKFLTSLSSTLTKVATQTRDVQTGLKAGATAATDLNRNFATFGDKVVQVNRGGVSATRDFSDVLAILQVNEERLIKLPREQQMRTVAQAFLRAEQNAKRLALTETQLNAISKDVFGVPTESADILAKALLNIGAKQDELAKQQRAATAANIKGAEDVGSAQEKLSQETQNTSSAIANATAGFRTKSLEAIADVMAAIFNYRKETESTRAFARGILQDPTFQPFAPLKDEANKLPTFFEGITNKITEFFKKVEYVDPNASDQIQTEFADLPSFFDELIKNLTSIWNGFWKSLSISAQAAALDMKNVTNEANKAQTAVETATGAKTTSVLRGTGSGTVSGYGPPGSAYGESTGTPGSRLQSDVPGLSNYQAPLPKVVYPMDESTSKGWTDAIKTAAESSADAAASSKSAAEASAKAVNAWVDQSFSAYAAGGMIHGAGSGTSDSILARLSNGEYVMQARAVEHWGPHFMDAINGFSAGGLVRPVPSFAGGGMVTARTADGATVVLQFPGGSFALQGDKAIVAGLTREARRAGMLNAHRLDPLV